VSAGYFKAMRIPLRAGRLLAEGDGAGAGLAAVISERLAQKWWPGEGFPIGRHFRLGAPSEKDVAKRPWITIVGIVGDVETSVLDRAPRPTLYVPYLQHPRRAMGIGIRVAGDPMRLAASVRAAIRAVDAEQPATNMLTLERLKHDEAIALTYSAALMGILGAVAMVLSLTGVYGLTAYLVSEQTHEIGIRVALGASRGSVLGMVFRRGMLPAIAGLALGILLASVLARVMAAVIWGVNPGDATAFIGMPLALSLAVATATYIAARRALKIEPIIALRAE
jgi:putative ABC transport system permease protein